MLPGDALVMYTDGVTESSNDAGDDFGTSDWRRPFGAGAISGLKQLLKALWTRCALSGPANSTTT